MAKNDIMNSKKTDEHVADLGSMEEEDLDLGTGSEEGAKPPKEDDKGTGAEPAPTAPTAQEIDEEERKKLEDATAPTAPTAQDGVTAPTAQVEEKGATGVTATAKEDGATAPTAITDEDVFAMQPAATGVNASTEDLTAVNYKSLAEQAGILGEVTDEKSLIQAIKTNVSDASVKTELDLSKYNPEAQALIKLVNDPDIELLEVLSPINKIDNYLATATDEQLVKDYLIQSEKISISEAHDKVAELFGLGDGSFESKVKDIRLELMQGKKEIMEERLTSLKQAHQQRQEGIDQEARTERVNMLKVVDETDTFMGLEIPVHVKDALKKQIETGVLSEANNNARTQVHARMFELFGDKAIQRFSARLKDERRAGFNEGREGIEQHLHGKPTAQEAGHANDTEHGEKDLGPLSAFEGIEDGVGVEENK